MPFENFHLHPIIKSTSGAKGEVSKAEIKIAFGISIGLAMIP